MPRKSKDIKGKIVDFLRENGGKAVVNATKNAAKFDCTPPVIGYSLRQLIGAGIITTSSPTVRGSHKPVEFSLSDGFGEGESWRDLLKRRSGAGAGKTTAARTKLVGASQSAQTEGGGRDSSVILAFSRELLGVYAELEEAQNKIVGLQERITVLEKGKAELQEKLDIEMRERKKQAEELVAMDARMYAARSRSQEIKERIKTLEEAGLR